MSHSTQEPSPSTSLQQRITQWLKREYLTTKDMVMRIITLIMSPIRHFIHKTNLLNPRHGTPPSLIPAPLSASANSEGENSLVLSPHTFTRMKNPLRWVTSFFNPQASYHVTTHSLPESLYNQPLITPMIVYPLDSITHTRTHAQSNWNPLPGLTQRLLTWIPFPKKVPGILDISYPPLPITLLPYCVSIKMSPNTYIQSGNDQFLFNPRDILEIRAVNCGQPLLPDSQNQYYFTPNNASLVVYSGNRSIEKNSSSRYYQVITRLSQGGPGGLNMVELLTLFATFYAIIRLSHDLFTRVRYYTKELNSDPDNSKPGSDNHDQIIQSGTHRIDASSSNVSPPSPQRQPYASLSGLAVNHASNENQNPTQVFSKQTSQSLTEGSVQNVKSSALFSEILDTSNGTISKTKKSNRDDTETPFTCSPTAVFELSSPCVRKENIAPSPAPLATLKTTLLQPRPVLQEQGHPQSTSCSNDFHVREVNSQSGGNTTDIFSVFHGSKSSKESVTHHDAHSEADIALGREDSNQEQPSSCTSPHRCEGSNAAVTEHNVHSESDVDLRSVDSKQDESSNTEYSKPDESCAPNFGHTSLEHDIAKSDSPSGLVVKGLTEISKTHNSCRSETSAEHTKEAPQAKVQQQDMGSPNLVDNESVNHSTEDENLAHNGSGHPHNTSATDQDSGQIKPSGDADLTLASQGSRDSSIPEEITVTRSNDDAMSDVSIDSLSPRDSACDHGSYIQERAVTSPAIELDEDDYGSLSSHSSSLPRPLLMVNPNFDFVDRGSDSDSQHTSSSHDNNGYRDDSLASGEDDHSSLSSHSSSLPRPLFMVKPNFDFVDRSSDSDSQHTSSSHGNNSSKDGSLALTEENTTAGPAPVVKHGLLAVQTNQNQTQINQRGAHVPSPKF